MVDTETCCTLCHSCKVTPSRIYCHEEHAFLCATCDAKIHQLATRHPRVLVCEVCERAPAVVTCKVDEAALCAACDHDVHTVNLLATRHVRLPVVSFYGAKEEAQPDTWLLRDANNNNNNNNNNDNDNINNEHGQFVYKYAEYLLNDVDPYFDIDDPEENKIEYGSSQNPDPVVDGLPKPEVDCSGSKPLMYDFASLRNRTDATSSSLDVEGVLDHNAMGDISNGTYIKTKALPAPLSAVEREERVLRYREKRKYRKFIKTIRYASRKAHAEARPRNRGRFAKRSEPDVDPLVDSCDCYQVVPDF